MKKFYVAETYRCEDGKDYEVIDRASKTITVQSGESIFFKKKIKNAKTSDGVSVEAITLPGGILHANACVSRPWLYN